MWLTIQEASNHFKVSHGTLRNYDAQGRITTKRTSGGQRRFWNKMLIDETDEDSLKQAGTNPNPDRRIIYARVSTANQKESLERQIEELERYKRNKKIEAEVIRDIGSGINFKRKGLKTLLDLTYQGSITEVIVTDKDRLARFAYDLIEDILSRNGVKITVVHENDRSKTRDEELVEDILTIVHVFSARSNGGKRYNKVKENEIVKESDSSQQSDEE